MSAEFSKLVDYWFGELEPEEEAGFEEHLFGCAECTAELERLAALGAAVRGAWRSGAVRAVISPALLEAMRQASLRLREYRVPPGGSVNCTIKESDDFVVSRLAAPLAGVRRVDLVTAGGRLEDVPFDPAAGEVLVCPTPAALKRAGAHVDRVSLVAVEEAGERLLGEYTFVHTPG